MTSNKSSSETIANFKESILDILEKLLANRTLMALVGLFILSFVLSIVSPYFLTSQNIFNVLRQVSIIAIMAIGMTYVIIAGGIDLSVGSVLALSSTITAIILLEIDNILISIIAGLIVGTFAGFINALLITSKISMPPFIATLAMLSVARGLTLVITGGMPIFGFPQEFAYIGAGYVFGVIPVPVVIMLVLYGIGIYFLDYTRTGLYIFAVGGNEEAARLSGINVSKVRTITYVISGFLSAVGGIILSSRISSIEPVAGAGYELDAIAAAVIGGASMSGGIGSLAGTIVGALIMGVLRNGLNLLDVSVYWQQVVIGIVIAVTVAVGMLKKK